MSGRQLLLVVAAALGYLMLDGHPESWLSGLPWRPPSLMLAVLGGIVLWIAWPRMAPSPVRDSREDGTRHPERSVTEWRDLSSPVTGRRDPSTPLASSLRSG